MKQSETSSIDKMEDRGQHAVSKVKARAAMKATGLKIDTLSGTAGTLLPAPKNQHVIYQLSSSRAPCLMADECGRTNPFEKKFGAITLAPTGKIPVLWLLGTATFTTFSLDDEFVRSICEEMDSARVTTPAFRSGIRHPSITALLQLIAQEHRCGRPLGALYSESLAHALAVQFVLADVDRRAPVPSTTSALPEHILSRVKARIEADLGESLTLVELAKESGYSRAHFVRMFQASLGKTPHQYILAQRIRRAQRMLGEDHGTLAEIAIACGFSSQAHMTVSFRHALGTTPGQYRRG
jgi:AraC family transcriptional regulator